MNPFLEAAKCVDFGNNMLIVMMNNNKKSATRISTNSQRFMTAISVSGI